MNKTNLKETSCRLFGPERRSQRVTIYLTVDEFLRVEKAANARLLTKADYCRMFIPETTVNKRKRPVKTARHK